MRKSEMVLKLTRMYGIRHVMVEGGYITPTDFMKEVLEYALHLGMKPPLDGPHSYSTHDWTPEPVCPVVKTQVDKLIRVDMGPHAGRDYKKDLFADKLPKKKNDDDDDSGNFPCGAV